MTWLAFLTSAALIGASGIFLTRYGDAIADKTGLGGSWVGLVLVATVTSLPELVAGASAVILADAPEIAVGNVLGACVLNLLMLAVVDFLKGGKPLYSSAAPDHVLSAGLSIILLGTAAMGLVLAHIDALSATGALGVISPLLGVLYLVSVSVSHRYQKSHVTAFTDEQPDAFPHLSLFQVARRYAAASGVIVLAGIWLPYSTLGLAHTLGWHEGFAGTLLTAFATTLPEMVVTLSALRLGAIDLAVGNLFGSNLFNLAILAVNDGLYTQGPLWVAVSPAHLISVLSALTMTGTALVALYYRSPGRWRNRGDWPSLLLVLLFIANTLLVHRMTQ
jgi:cation:H+ antiporter